MDRNEKDRILSRIMLGDLIVTGHMIEPFTQIILCPANSLHKTIAANIYDTVLSDALLNGLMSEAEAKSYHNTMGDWTVYDEKQINDLQNEIHKLKRSLLDYLFKVNQLEQIRSNIRKAEELLNNKFIQRANVFGETAESFALSAYQKSIIASVAHIGRKKIWKTIDDFYAFDNLGLIDYLCNVYFGSSRYSEKVLRELSRTEPWRGYWSTAKQLNVPLFKGLICDWSYNQIELARWSSLYDIVYESIDRPSEQVIVDDDLLDSWFIRQSEKLTNQIKKHETESHLGGVPNKPGRNEVFVFTDKEGAKRVFDLNTPTAKMSVKQTQNIVKQKGIVQETELPISQQEMREQLISARRK